MSNDNDEKLNKISNDILILSRNSVLVNLRFLDVAISRLELVRFGESLMCDGKYILYNPKFVVSSYLTAKELPVRAYLHVLMHCIFRHMYISTMLDQKCWDLACDMAVESSINDLGIKCVDAACFSTPQGSMLENIKKEVGQLTAEKIYRYLYDNYLDNQRELERMSKLFNLDDHSIWYMREDEKQSMLSAAGIGSGQSTSGSFNNRSTSDSSESSQNSSDYALNSKEDWANISEHIQQDIQTFAKSQGFEAGCFSQNLAELNREKYDYEAFLKKFAVLGETMKINDDEFDYIYYTYGLSLYKNMPLIEPLEYKEEKRIKEFVIAIDTSGSVVGEEVQSFIQKTCNILKSTESFFSKINVHIIQCDVDIQEHIKITSQEEFDNYIKTMSIKGLGGTDFRPVFDAVDQLILNKEFTNLKGLIYFTDGLGTFPDKKPQYDSAFVFVNDDAMFTPNIPPWAIKLILQRHEL